jgi:CubicO group peptidase (beta-lactamase class C family)
MVAAATIGCSTGTARIPAAAVPGQLVVTRLDGKQLTPAQIDTIVQRRMRGAEIPGLAIAIIDDSEIKYVRAYGYRDVARRLPLTDTTVMYAASLTKAMFAYMVMQLVEEGQLDLDVPIEKYLQAPLAQDAKYGQLANDPRYVRITPRMLLSHTSGLPNWRFINRDGKLDIKFAPGSRFSYSGEGINLLQMVIEAHTHRAVGDLMQERVFGPLRMSRTSMTWQKEFESDYALGYDTLGRSVGHNRRSSARAAGSADTDISDMARFAAAILQGRGLSASAREQMLSAQVRINSVHQFPTPTSDTTSRDAAIHLSYGLGWGLLTSPHGRAYFKEGHDDDSWRNYMISFDGPKKAIIIMSNSAHAEEVFPALLADLMADVYTPAEWERYGQPGH